jgi:glycogen operon protein
MHVDGFRFDLATTLARDPVDFDPSANFLDAIGQDPVLSRVKLIAEPWDIGEGGHQMGSFPAGWAEWNDRYRDVVRRFWKGEAGQSAELASRLSGSSDIFGRRGRRPWASINYITAHDGFTLRDLVSHEHKHNEANGEGNRDGSDASDSWNCGIEGQTGDPGIRALRIRQSKNLLATLLFSQGVPMLLAGDEMGRSQRGNNNAYCQDNETSWVDWNIEAEEQELLAFVRSLVHFRRQHIAFHRHRFFRGRDSPSEAKDITWLRSDGSERDHSDWEDPEHRTLAFVLNGDALGYHLTHAGEPEVDDTFLVLLNGNHHPDEFQLPDERFGRVWRRVLSSDPMGAAGERVKARERHSIGAATVDLFVQDEPFSP